MADKNIDTDHEITRIFIDEMEETFYNLLVKEGFVLDKARTCAKIFTENSVDGVYTHGVNRFPRFIKYVREQLIKINAEPLLINTVGAVEQWDGQSGPGILNALFCTERVMNCARLNGIGCVTIANTNHWMRGGTYGWKAAREGFVFICWTNTIANMPPWGAKESRLGNNPMIMGLPYQDEAIVLDMAVSQFSFGKVELMKLQGERLPVAGGLDRNGNLTDDPVVISESNLLLPVGYWKGSGLALLLDILAAVLSGGLSTSAISKQASEINVSQVFIAIDISKLHNASAIPQTLQTIIADYKNAETLKGKKIRYPGEGIVNTRNENLQKGVPVHTKIWNEIISL